MGRRGTGSETSLGHETDKIGPVCLRYGGERG